MKQEIEKGYRFNDFTVIDSNIKTVSYGRVLICKCKCGNVREITLYTVQRKKIKCCKECYIKERKENSLPKIGQKFHDWTVISSERILKGEESRGNYLFKVKCKCGFEKNLPVYVLNTGRSKMCRICRSNRRLKLYKELPLLYFKRIKIGALDRNLKFTITPKYIYDLFIQQRGFCILSGVKIEFFPVSLRTQKGRRNHTASLDRIDSTRGYIKGNVQWVHKRVNAMKMDMNDKEFIEWCKLIVNNDLKNKYGI